MDGLRTPITVVDRARLARNIAWAQRVANGRGAQLRPHVKTHKCVEIAHQQMEAGAVGISVATIGEAECFAAASLTDIFIAYPLWVTRTAALRLRRLTDRCRLTIGVDSIRSAQRIGRTLGGSGLHVLVEIDCGQHRTGCLPPEAAGVAEALLGAGDVEVDGVFTFPGHSYAPGARARAAGDEAEALVAAAEGLEAVGIPAPVRSGGSTPSLAYGDARLTQFRPGVYVFGDAQQWELGACTPDDIALTVHSRVVSVRGSRIALDAGSKALGADRAPWATGYGRLLDHPQARIELIAEHHAIVELHGGPVPAVGDVVRVVPNHCCNAVNLVEELAVDEPCGPRWRVAARGAND